jgi:hypothetical protein
MSRTPQGLGGHKVAPWKMFERDAFHFGFLARNKKFFEPEVFFNKEWDQVAYERGYHFNTWLRTKGVVIKKLPKRPTFELKQLISEAVTTGALI